MPDILAHYMLSYLVASRAVRPRNAVLLALIGLLPDIDAFLRIHRWITHSLVLAIIGISIATIPALFMNHEYLRYLAQASTLYILHIVLDIFTAPTPILWPATNQAYMLSIELTSTITQDAISIAPQITIHSETVDLAPRLVLEGPLVSTTGVLGANGVLAMIITEYLYKKKQ